jgi:uncharacterized membrane protein
LNASGQNLLEPDQQHHVDSNRDGQKQEPDERKRGHCGSHPPEVFFELLLAGQILFKPVLDRLDFVFDALERGFVFGRTLAEGCQLLAQLGNAGLDRMEVDRGRLQPGSQQVGYGQSHVAVQQGQHLLHQRDRGPDHSDGPFESGQMRFRPLCLICRSSRSPARNVGPRGMTARRRPPVLPDFLAAAIAFAIFDYGADPGGLRRSLPGQLRFTIFHDRPALTDYKGTLRTHALLGCAWDQQREIPIVPGVPGQREHAAGVAYPRLQENPLRPFLGHLLRHVQRYILAGLITIGPLFVTWLVFSFVLGNLARAGLPLVQMLGNVVPGAWFEQAWIQSILAVALTLVVLYVVGRITSLVVGRQAFNLFEAVLERLPFVAKVYTSVRQLLDTMMAKKETSQRVVLVDFPIEGQKSIGFLTRTLTDSITGRELAAVLLPNAINPTSAFLQVLPLERVTETDLTMEQAMSMLMTGGAVSPDNIRFAHGSGAPIENAMH